MDWMESRFYRVRGLSSTGTAGPGGVVEGVLAEETLPPGLDGDEPEVLHVGGKGPDLIDGSDEDDLVGSGVDGDVRGAMLFSVVDADEKVDPGRRTHPGLKTSHEDVVVGGDRAVDALPRPDPVLPEGAALAAQPFDHARRDDRRHSPPPHEIAHAPGESSEDAGTGRAGVAREEVLLNPAAVG